MQNLDLPNLKNCNVAVIGLGYVGLPLAIKISNQKFCKLSHTILERKVYGYDINKLRINELEEGVDRNKIFSKRKLTDTKNLLFTNNKEHLKNIDVFIITVPTPIDINNEPNLSHLAEASKLVGESIKERDQILCNPIIIFESTVYPGATEEICVPLIKKISKKEYNSKNYNNSFYSGYSPERINPGDSKFTIDSIVKVTSGCNKEVAKWVDSFYGSFISAGTFKVSNIKIAEAAKIIENTQRDINIALVNELSMLFKKMNINTKEVLDAANTKWNFHKYSPGLVGGHCIGVDPYYLSFKAKKIGYNTKLISAGRDINDLMHKYLLEQILIVTNSRKDILKQEEVLVLGISYKANCGDIRNSQLIYLVENLKKTGMNITIVDPQVNQDQVLKKIGLFCLSSIPKEKKYTLIIFALSHIEFKGITINDFHKISVEHTKIFDLTNKFTGDHIFNL